MSLLVIGSISKDIVFRVDTFPSINEEAFGRVYSQYDGGAGANVSVYIKKIFDISTHLISCVGNDDYGVKHISRLDKLGVGIGYIKTLEGFLSTRHIIVLDKFENRITYVYSGAMEHFSPDLYGKAIFKKTKNIYIAPIKPSSILKIYDNLHNNEKNVFFNPGSAFFGDLNAFNKILGCTYCLILNENECLRYSNTSNIFNGAKYFCKKGVSILSVTLGHKGSLTFEGNNYYYGCGFDVAPVLTVGCGDAYAAAFVASLMSGCNIIDATNTANALGAFISLHDGIRDYIPLKDELFSFKENTKKISYRNYKQNTSFNLITN